MKGGVHVTGRERKNATMKGGVHVTGREKERMGKNNIYIYIYLKICIHIYIYILYRDATNFSCCIYTSESGWTYNIFYLNRKKTETRGQRQSWRALHMQQLLFVSYE